MIMEILLLLIASIIMFGSTVVILYLGHRKGTPNTILWALFTFTRGIHWLVEFLADYNEEILDNEILILDRFEIITAFISVFVLLAACLEFNETIRKPFGKIIALLASIIPLYLLFSIDDYTLEEIEDTIYFRGSAVISEPFRFLYGFIIPVISAAVIIAGYLYYRYQVKRGQIFENPKMKRTVLIIAVLILLFAIFEGFDYDRHEELFLVIRAITGSLFIILPLVIIISTDLGLQRFFIIEQSGIPLFIYNFQTKESAMSDEKSFLTSGFLTAIINFADELSAKKGGFLSIRSSYLYYTILKTETKLYAIQSILYNKNLESQFFNATEKIDSFIANFNKNSISDNVQLKEIMDENFSIFF